MVVKRMINSKDGLLDLKGETTGSPFRWGMIIYPLVGILAMIICTNLPILAYYGEKTGLALGFFIFIVLLFLSQCFAMEVVCMVLVAGGYFLGLWEWSTFQTASGNSSFLQMLCMFVVAAGANTTPIGQRIALWILRKIGNKPIRLVLGYAIATAFISSFISNTATLILMSSIANSMLLTMKEKPGTSKLGRTLFLIIPAASYWGGIGLINGSPGSNVYGLGYLSSFTGGLYVPDYRQFAMVNYPIMVLLIVPLAVIYIKALRLKDTDVNSALPEDYFEELSKKSGPMTGGEIRWIIQVLAMIIWLFLGGHGTAVPLIIAAISLMPLIGTTSASKIWDNLPMPVLFLMFMASIMGQLWTGTGLIEAVSALLGPILGNFSPLALSIVMTFISLIVINILVNAGASVALPVFTSLGVALCSNMGANPGVVLLPMIVSLSMVWMVMLNSTSYVNFGYGWYKIEDAYLPGLLAILFVSIALPVLTFLIVPFAGMPIYL